jgi:hypothetical protein
VLYRALADQLGSEYTIFHSVAWISRPRGIGPRDGEADIVIVHPSGGILVIEVKGGKIRRDASRSSWTSTDAGGTVYKIKNPFEQAKTAKYALLEKLKEAPAWQKLRISRFNLGHAAFFPEVGDASRLSDPASPIALIGDQNDLPDLSKWVERVFDFWSTSEGGRYLGIGLNGMRAFIEIFARDGTTRPLLSARLREEEDTRIELTDRQVGILDLLQRQRRVMIAGGAGTGKTLIAKEKATRLAREGMRVLLLCFNRGLADHLREQCAKTEGLDVATFHQVCDLWTRRVLTESGIDLLAEARRAYPGADLYNELMPIALTNAVDRRGGVYDAIIVDEAQDFSDDFWLPVEMLLTDLDAGLLYVFLDENQDIYRRSAKIPVRGEPLVLDRNCRNTAPIHDVVYRHYRGGPVQRPPIPGSPVEILAAPTLELQAQQIARLITRLIQTEGVAAHDIAVLLCKAFNRETCERLLLQCHLPRSVRIGRIEDYGLNCLTVDTVARFKGLERAVTIVWEFGDCDLERDREILYVGLSRAKSLLYLCGPNEPCALKLISPP